MGQFCCCCAGRDAPAQPPPLLPVWEEEGVVWVGREFGHLDRFPGRNEQARDRRLRRRLDPEEE